MGLCSRLNKKVCAEIPHCCYSITGSRNMPDEGSVFAGPPLYASLSETKKLMYSLSEDKNVEQQFMPIPLGAKL